MAIENDMEGKDPTVYGDVFSSGDPVEIPMKERAINLSILFYPAKEVAPWATTSTSTTPIETTEK